MGKAALARMTRCLTWLSEDSWQQAQLHSWSSKAYLGPRLGVNLPHGFRGHAGRGTSPPCLGIDL